MTASTNQDDFIADDFVPEEPQELETNAAKEELSQDQTSDDFEQDDFTPEEPKKKKRLEDLNWFEQNFSEEGNRMKSERSRNVVKGLISGVTAGYSEAIPGFQVDEGPEGTTGKIVGSLAPISYTSKAIGYPLKAAASLAPKFVKPLTHLASLVGLSAAGGLYEGLEESAEKSIEANDFVPPSPETILEQGAKWAAIDLALKGLGLGARFAKALWSKAEEAGVSAITLLEDTMSQVGKDTADKTSLKALSILEDKPLQQIEKEVGALERTKDISPQATEEAVSQRKTDLRDRKIEQQDFTKLAEETKPEPYLPEQFEATKIAEEAVDSELTNRMEDLSQRSPSAKALGESVKADIETTVKKNKAETDALYDVAKRVEDTKKPKLKKTANSIVEQIRKLQQHELNLSPEGYKKVQTQLVDTLTDLGYGVTTDSSGKITGAIKAEDISLSKSVEIKRRLNNIINYDIVDTSAKDFLKDPTNVLRGAIRAGYGPKSSVVRKAFEKAEKLFGEFAEQKGKKSIRSLRMSEKPESIARTIRTPSGLADVKSVVSPEQFSQVEREVLEHMNTLSEDSASKLYRELRGSMTDESKAIAEEIIQSKAPKGSPSRKVSLMEKQKDLIIDDIAKSTITGQRPETALKMWKTVKGQQLIKNALENNPNKKQVLKYLEEQSFKDFYQSIISPDGVIDFKKFNSLMKDKATVNNIRLVAGEDGVKFLKNLETYNNRISKNKSIIEGKIDKASASERAKIEREINKRGNERLKTKKEKRQASEKEKRQASENSSIIYKIDDLVNSYGVKGKGALAMIGWYMGGKETAIVGSIGYEAFMHMAKNKKVQSAIKKASAPITPVEWVKAISEILDESDKD